MIVQYEDEYETELYKTTTDNVVLPNIGDTVMIADNQYITKARTFYPDAGGVVITLAEGGYSLKAPIAEKVDATRQNQMHNAIIELTKRQDVTEKKHRAVSDQLGSVKRGINQRIQQEKKDSNDQTR